MSDTARLDAQLAFLIEADKLKSVNRSSLLSDNSRPENSAEHSWHAALWALVFHDASHDTADLNRAIAMLLLHDIVEIDAGDHPIHLESHGQAAAETAAAIRLFGLLPDDQGKQLHALWSEFEAGKSADAAFAKTIDHTQPIFQSLCTPHRLPEHIEIIRNNLQSGRAKNLPQRWPEAHTHATAMLADRAIPPDDFTKRLAFVTKADMLKTVLRATPLCDGSRPENSGEHSWHIALYALVLAEHSTHPINIGRVIQMLLLHDLVEIDAGDTPIHGDHDKAAQEAKEQAAATHIFGLLPHDQASNLRTIWDEFEAAQSNDAIFAKSLDRVQPLISNLETDGGSWIAYNVTLAQIESRVGVKVRRGAPALWAVLKPRIDAWFSAHT